MGIRDIASTLVQVPDLLKLKQGMRPRPATERDCVALLAEQNAARLPDHVAIAFEGAEATWAELNALANRYAHTLQAAGVQSGDAVSVLMENRIEFLATFLALNKLGAIAGLINTNVRDQALKHCIAVTGSRRCIVGEELTAAMEDVKAELAFEEGADYFWMRDKGESPPPNWARDLAQESADVESGNLASTQDLTLGHTACHIFTSGTTGLPKAAVVSNQRCLTAAKMSAIAGLKCGPEDRLYNCLPLYHGTGLMIGAGAALASGASMFVRRKFSASNFLREVRDQGATCFVYIGELCRYLCNTPRAADDHANPLTRMMGNGLRPDVWMDFKERFGIKRIAEFYGASEGNVAFANLFNKDRTIGMTSSEVALVEYDVEADEIARDGAGHCVAAAPGEPGLLLARISEQAVFEGYTDGKATEQKIIRNAFKDGDAWFNSGDLLRTVDVGFNLGYPHYQFVDRVGDTFRWKSENVSTNEVGEILNGCDQVEFCNVYGVEVPKADGRAGMAAIRLAPGVSELDVDAFTQFVSSSLPAYARPVFLRIQPDIDVTATMKLLKRDLKKEGYDPALVTDPLYFLTPATGRYQRLDADLHAAIRAGEAGL